MYSTKCIVLKVKKHVILRYVTTLINFNLITFNQCWKRNQNVPRAYFAECHGAWPLMITSIIMVTTDDNTA